MGAPETPTAQVLMTYLRYQHKHITAKQYKSAPVLVAASFIELNYQLAIKLSNDKQYWQGTTEPVAMGPFRCKAVNQSSMGKSELCWKGW